MRTLSASIVVLLTIVALHTSPAMAECNCVAVASSLGADVDGQLRAQVAKADGLYARGDYQGALAIYAKAHQETGAAVLLYAQAMCEWQLGMPDARAHFSAVVDAGGAVDAEFRARAEAAVSALESGVSTPVRDLAGGVAGTVGGVAGVGAGVAGGVAGEVRGTVDRPKKKVAKGAAVVLGVVAVAAIAAVAVHGIVASRDADVDFDTKFGVGLGLSGAIAGGTAFYLWGLTAATGAAGGVGCGVATRF